MAGSENSAPDPRLFADKGRARPASGLKSVVLSVAPDATAPAPEAPPDSADAQTAGDGEPEDAASLQVGGFKSVRPVSDGATASDAAAPEAPLFSGADVTAPAGNSVSHVRAVPPPDIVISESRTSLRPLIIAVAFSALLLVSLGIGYAVSALFGGDAGADGAAAQPERATPAAD